MFVVGFGPGDPLDRTRRAEEAIAASSVVVGYKPYLDRIADLIAGKESLHSGMKQEVDRVRLALERARRGDTVALVSSGDSGIYGMAGLAMEMAAAEDVPVAIQVVPGVTAATAAASKVGAPLMLDYATISLSDLLVPWATIEKRLRAVLEADMVLALYNPKSKTRTEPFENAIAMARAIRDGQTPVVIATAMGQSDEEVQVTTLDKLDPADVSMKSIVLLGNSTTTSIGPWLVNPRGYVDKYLS